MELRISDSEGSWEIRLPIDSVFADALGLQMSLLERNPRQYDEIKQILGKGICKALVDTLDTDIRPPSDAQVDYAVAIARELSVNLPGEALRFRGAMKEFLDRFVPLYRQRTTRSAD